MKHWIPASFVAVALISATLLAAVVYVWVISWSQSYGWPTVLRGNSIQLKLRTGRIFILRAICPPEGTATFVSFTTPSVLGQPGKFGRQWYIPGADEAIERAISEQMDRDGQPCRHVEFPPGVLPVSSASNLWGFGVASDANMPLLAGWQRSVISIPIWFVALVLSFPPFVVVWKQFAKVHHRRRVQRGLCPDCGYDLRATLDRCPECGIAAAVGQDGASI